MLTFVICEKRERPCECQEPDIPSRTFVSWWLMSFTSLSVSWLIGIVHFVVFSPFCIVIAVYTRVCLVLWSNCSPMGPDVLVSFWDTTYSWTVRFTQKSRWCVWGKSVLQYGLFLYCIWDGVINAPQSWSRCILEVQSTGDGDRGTYWVTTQITALRGSLCESAPPMSSLVHFCPLWPLSRCFGLSGQGD